MSRIHPNIVGVLFVFCVAIHSPASYAIYINPLHPDGTGLADNLGDADQPAVGLAGDNTGPGATFLPYCTGSLIDSNISPSHSWVLTAGHCAAGSDAAGRFQPGGTSGTVQSSDRVRLHPDFTNPPIARDLSLMRLDSTVPSVTPLSIRRTPVVAGTTTFTAIGFGHTNYVGGTTNTGFPTKRRADFSLGSVGTAGSGNANDFTFSNGGNGTNANPTRQICQGDSGGPSLFSGVIGGVHSNVSNPGGGGGFSPCNGANTANRDANVTNDYMYNWIDSYSRMSNFWDSLELLRFPVGGGAPPTVTTIDEFEVAAAARGTTGLPPGWSPGAPVMHPVLGMIDGSDPDRYRYFNSIGTDRSGAPELFVGLSSGLGSLMQNGDAHTIQLSLGLEGDPEGPYNFCVSVSQRWNSLGMGADIGLAVPSIGSESWGGLSYATTSDIDLWRSRIACSTIPPEPGMHLAIVTLVNVPEPSTLFLSLLALPLILHRRRA